MSQALERFVWQTVHGRFYRRREDWFEPHRDAAGAVVGGGRPSPDAWTKASRGSNILKAQGPSDEAFGWESLADAQLWKTQRGVKAAARPLAAAAAQ